MPLCLFDARERTEVPARARVRRFAHLFSAGPVEPAVGRHAPTRFRSTADAFWITEVWDSPESHKASLTLPDVRQAIARGKPLIASIGDGVITTPVGGYGLSVRNTGLLRD